MTCYASLMLAVGIYAFLLSLSNIAELWRLSRKARPRPQGQCPLVSVCVPARNESANIESCLRSLMKQDYPHYEILVLNDNSEDDTAGVVRRLSREDGRIRLINGTPPPKGWKGKVHAMQQLYENATGDYLLFTDADTTHSPISISLGVRHAQANNAALVSGYPTEKSTRPLISSCIAAMVFMTMLYLPIPLQNRIQKSWFAMAIGQYVLVSRKAIEEIGGLSGIRNSICDDVQLARLFARTGHKQIFCDMKKAVTCRMYNTLDEAFSGIERSVVGAINLSPLLFFGIIILILILIGFIVSPIVTTLFMILSHCSPPSLVLLTGTVLFCGAFILVTTFHGYRFPVQLMFQFTFVFLLSMFAHGFYRRWSGQGFVWKGRKIE